MDNNSILKRIPYYIQESNSYEITNDITLQGFSRSAHRTGFVIKSKTKPIDDLEKFKEEIEAFFSPIGYMDRTDFEYELGQASGGNIVYPNIEDLKEHKAGCINECGIVKVKVELVEVIEEGHQHDIRRSFNNLLK